MVFASSTMPANCLKNLKEPFFFLSDTHISSLQDNDQIQRYDRVMAFLDMVKKCGGTLFILGDFFDFWFDCRNYIHPKLFRAAQKLCSLSKSGIPIHFIAGNHDYWIKGRLTRECHISFYPESLEFTWKGKRFFCQHGDNTVYKFRLYPLARRLMRSSFAIACLKCLPCQFIYQLGESVSHYNRPLDDIKEVENKYLEKMIAFLKTKLDEGVDIALSGHVHIPYIHKNGRSVAAVPGDWVHHNTYGIFENGQFRLESFVAGK